MTPKAISEIINTACKFKTAQEKVDYLLANESIPLRTVLKFTYDTDRIKFLLPSEPPPWKKNGYKDVEGMLYRETRRFGIFVEGGGYNTLKQVEREHQFISLLESIDDNDAELLVKMIQQKPLTGLPKSVVQQAFPQDYVIKQETDTKNA